MLDKRPLQRAAKSGSAPAGTAACSSSHLLRRPTGQHTVPVSAGDFKGLRESSGAVAKYRLCLHAHSPLCTCKWKAALACMYSLGGKSERKRREKKEVLLMKDKHSPARSQVSSRTPSSWRRSGPPGWQTCAGIAHASERAQQPGQLQHPHEVHAGGYKGRMPAYGAIFIAEAQHCLVNALSKD